MSGAWQVPPVQANTAAPGRSNGSGGSGKTGGFGYRTGAG